MLICSMCAAVNGNDDTKCHTCSEQLRAPDFLSDTVSEEQLEATRSRILRGPEPEGDASSDRETVEPEPVRETQPSTSQQSRQCPYCEGAVSRTAQKCHRCGEWLTRSAGARTRAAPPSDPRLTGMLGVIVTFVLVFAGGGVLFGARSLETLLFLAVFGALMGVATGLIARSLKQL